MPEPEYAIVGLIRKAQGIRGEVIVEPLTTKPDVVFASGSRVYAGDSNGELVAARDVRGEEEHPTLTIEHSKPFKNGLIVQFEELRDRNAAELWRGRYLLAPFSELPALAEDELYLHDLVGMKVNDLAGKELGTVTNYYELPHGVLLDVATSTGTVMIPYRPEIVKSADRERRAIVVDASSGFFDDESTYTDE